MEHGPEQKQNHGVILQNVPDDRKNEREFGFNVIKTHNEVCDAIRDGVDRNDNHKR
jgi:hypothetical protein